MFNAQLEVKKRLETLFPTETIFAGMLKDGDGIPDKAIFVNKYGLQSLRQMGNRKETQLLRVQLTIRGNIESQSSCETLSDSIYNKLQSTSWVATTGEEIEDIRQLSESPVVQDSQKRYVKTRNFELHVYIDLDTQ